MRHASIIPLIGGEVIAATKAFGERPDYLLSYSPFKDNESHLLNYWNNEVPYYVLDEGQKHPYDVDVVSSVCPCAGLSQMSQGFGDHNVNNQWMYKTANYVLGEMKPQVFYGENAPGFAGKIGQTVRTDLYNIGRKNGYSMTVYRTKALLHGVSQVRERSFYFFWKGEQTPLLNYYNTSYKRIETVLESCAGSNFQTETINTKTPSEDPYYRFILEEIHDGMKHKDFAKIIETSTARSNDVQSYIEHMGYDYKQIGSWMEKNGYEREIKKCEYKYNKIEANGNIMRRGTIIPRDYIGAFVGHYPTSLTHHIEDRYINYREAMTIMGLPQDFELLNPKKSVNHICQNVPFETAYDMSTEVKEYLGGNRPIVNSTYTFQYNGTQTHKFGDEQETSSLERFF